MFEVTLSTSCFIQTKFDIPEHLPDFDSIASLRCEKGMYDCRRWPNSAKEQIRFLQKVVEKYGETAEVSLHEAYDGYPGYIKVTW